MTRILSFKPKLPNSQTPGAIIQRSSLGDRSLFGGFSGLGGEALGEKRSQKLPRVRDFHARHLFSRSLAVPLAAARGGSGLTDFHVPEPHLLESLQNPTERGVMLEDFGALVAARIENFVYVLALEATRERLRVVTLAAANVARNVHVGEKMH